MFPKRIILGVGTGESLNEAPASGMEWPETKERFARLREALALIRRLWCEERGSFQGDFYKTANATIYDRPKAPFPNYIDGAAHMITKYAGRTADECNGKSVKPDTLYAKPLFPNLAADLEVEDS